MGRRGDEYEDVNIDVDENTELAGELLTDSVGRWVDEQEGPWCIVLLWAEERSTHGRLDDVWEGPRRRKKVFDIVRVEQRVDGCVMCSQGAALRDV